MRVLVTGSEGFLGKHVVKALGAAGHTAIRYDLVLGLGHEITKPPGWPWPSPDVVIHLAAMAAPLACDRDPAAAFNVNVNGTLNALRSAMEAGAKKFVFASSAHVYGVGPKFLPTPETHPLSLGNTYTTTKVLGEELCRLYWANHGMPYTVLRLYNVYGPGQGPGYFIPDMLAKTRIDLKDGNTTKDWVYVDDVARAFVLAAESAFVGEINIGTGVEHPLYDVAAQIANAMDVPFAFSTSLNATRMCADITRAVRVLGWSPDENLQGGLRATIRAQSPTP